MKKILFSCVAAICMTIGLSSFSSVQTANLYWFDPIWCIHISSVNCFTNVQVIYNDTQGMTDPQANLCSGADYYCHLGFLTSQIITDGLGGYVLKTKSVDPFFPTCQTVQSFTTKFCN